LNIALRKRRERKEDKKIKREIYLNVLKETKGSITRIRKRERGREIGVCV